MNTPYILESSANSCDVGIVAIIVIGVLALAALIIQHRRSD